MTKSRCEIAEARVFVSWRNFQMALKCAVTPLNEEQLGQRILPGRRTPGEIAEHIVFGRALHLSQVLGEDAAELAPYLRWERQGDSPRSAAEIVRGLDVTWQTVEDRIMCGSSTDEITDGDSEALRTIWGLLDHDLPHAGQLSLLLRAIGMPGLDI